VPFQFIPPTAVSLKGREPSRARVKSTSSERTTNFDDLYGRFIRPIPTPFGRRALSPESFQTLLIAKASMWPDPAGPATG
jgi:hypothetical protein